LQREGFHAQPTRLALTFSGALNRSTAQNSNNYIIVNPGPDGRVGTRDDRTIRVKTAVYDGARSTVTLTSARRLDLHRRYQLVVNGSTPTGVADIAGNLLDGDGNGQPGSNYVVMLRGFGRNEPGRPFRKLIRDQLGGKPMSSRRVNLRTTSTSSHQVYSGLQHSLRASVPRGPLSSRRTERDPIRGIKIAHNTLP
jgi:hypothetical protein